MGIEQSLNQPQYSGTSRSMKLDLSHPYILSKKLKTHFVMQAYGLAKFNVIFLEIFQITVSYSLYFLYLLKLTYYYTETDNNLPVLNINYYYHRVI